MTLTQVLSQVTDADMACLWISELLGLPCSEIEEDINLNLSNIQKECLQKVQSSSVTRKNLYGIEEGEPFQPKRGSRTSNRLNLLWLLSKFNSNYFHLVMMTSQFSGDSGDITKFMESFYHFRKARQRILSGMNINRVIGSYDNNEIISYMNLDNDNNNNKNKNRNKSPTKITNISTLQQFSKNNIKFL